MDSPYVEASTIENSKNKMSKSNINTNAGDYSENGAASAMSADEEAFVPDDRPTLDTESSAAATSTASSANTRADLPGRFLAYAKSGDLLEMICWVICMAVLAGLPRLTARTNWRDIPYQETAAGDILLELMYENELVDETVNNQLLVVVGAVLPLLLQIILCLIRGTPGDIHASICTYATALGISTFTVEFVKHYVGYLRPNFYEKCGFDYDTMQCDADIDTNAFTGRKSFMSGHSSMSFAGLTVFSLYLQRLFGVGSGAENAVVVSGTDADQVDGDDAGANILVKYRPVRPSRIKRVISVLCLLPMFGAVVIAASRVRDNYHHPADVVGGSVVGAAAAIWAMGVWFSPSLQVLSL